MRLKPFSLLFIFFILCGSSAFPDSGRGGGGDTAFIGRGPFYGGSLIFAVQGSIPNLDPALAYDQGSYQICSALYEGLVAFGSDSFRIVPRLAQTWEHKNNQIWTFFLRRNVKFHDGAPFDAASVKFNFDRLLDPASTYYAGGGVRFKVFQSLFGQYGHKIKRLEILDSHTIRIVLVSPDSAFLKKLAMCQFSLASPAGIRNSVLMSKPSGTGPFRLMEWRKPGRFILVVNETYWGRKPYLDRLIFETYADSESGLRQFGRGNVDVVPMLYPAGKYGAGSTRILTTRSSSYSNLCYLAINGKKTYLKEPALRSALSGAINRRELAAAADGMAAGCFLLPSLAGYKNVSLPLSASAGKSGRELNILCPSAPLPFVSEPEAAASAVSFYLKAAGIRSSVKTLPLTRFLADLHAGDFDLALWGASDLTGDSDSFLTLNWASGSVAARTNVAFFSEPEVDRLLSRGRSLPGAEARSGAYAGVDAILRSRLPAIPLFYSKHSFSYSSRVGNLNVHPSGIADLSAVWIEP